MSVSNWIIVGVDTGGTFTDTIAIKENEIKVLKLPSTPDDPKLAVISSIERLGQTSEVLHGTTVATNAVLQRKGARVLLITTKGFKDVIEIGRQNREKIYSLYPTRPEPLVPPDLRFEINERIVADGSIETTLSKTDIEILIQELKGVEFDSIAICTLFSFLNNTHEVLLKRSLQGIAPLSISSEVFPEYREYERMSTTVMDAYVKPIVSNYLSSLEEYLIDHDLTEVFAVMKSSKGLARGKSTAEYPIHTLFSGLAGGIKAAEFTSKLTNTPNLLSLDIGGTSTDVASITNGKNSNLQSLKVGGLPVSVPAVDVETIGAGGGSLIEVVAGLIRVGPQSAGAVPGPVAYDLGGKIPTVTDADLVFGVLPQELAGGELLMKKHLAEVSMNNLAEELTLSLEETVNGARRIFHENIAAALRSVSTQRGLDPRNYSLLAFGGAGPVHGCELADILGITQVIIPPIPGAWSAMGLLGGDYSYTMNQGYINSLIEVKLEEIEEIFSKLIEQAVILVNQDGIKLENEVVSKILAMRFQGQSFDLEVSYKESIEELRHNFIEVHRQRYGFAAENEPIEIVACRLTLTVPHDDPSLPKLIDRDEPNPVNFTSTLNYKEEIPIYNKSSLGKNFKKAGPLIINQLDTTIWIPSGWEMKLDEYGFIFAFRR